jgi:hypothetical protein
MLKFAKVILTNLHQNPGVSGKKIASHPKIEKEVNHQQKLIKRA